MGRQHSPTSVKTAIVLVGPSAPAPQVKELLPDADLVVAADSGAHMAAQLDLVIDIAVGDFDSIDSGLLEELEQTAVVERHPAAKDQTDIALALDAAIRCAPTRLVVVSGGGGRLDHAFANLLVLADPAYARTQIQAFVGDSQVWVIRDHQTLYSESGRTVSLIAVGGAAEGITTTGLAYPLDHESLAATSTRGVSNVMTVDNPTVRVQTGVILAISHFPSAPAPSER